MASTNPSMTSSASVSKQDQKVPYFPPPPTLSTSGEEKKKKPILKFKPPLPRVKPKQRRSSSRHTVGFSTQSRRERLQEVHLPAIKLSPRHWLLVSLLFLSFLILILDFIFADCVALPHTDKTDNPVDGNPIADRVTMYVRQLQTGVGKGSDNALGYDPSGNVPNVVGPSAPTAHPAGSVPGASAGNDTTDPSETLANESKRLGFDTPKNLAILFFYAATLPGLTIVHTIAELILLFCSKRRRTTGLPDEESKAEKDADSDADSISSIKNRPSSTVSAPKLPWLVTFLPAISLTISTLLTLGWITTNTIQFHCEVHPLSPSSSSQSICPIQTRGHFMHGIHELSIAKNVMGWILVAVYIGYVGWCARVSGLVWRAGREEKKEKRWVQKMERERVKHLRLQVHGGRAEVVVVQSDGVVREGGDEREKVANVNVAEVR